MRFAPEPLAKMRRGLMQRGQKLATILADLLAGKGSERDLAAIGLDARPGMRPEEIARAALAANEARRALIDADDNRFGRCDTCGVELGEASLLEVPWADRCPAHASAAPA